MQTIMLPQRNDPTYSKPWYKIFRWVRTREHEGMYPPSRWLAYAYYDFDRDVSIHYVFPINLIVVLAVWLRRKLWWEIPHKLSGRDSRLHGMLQVARQKGYERGYKAATNLRLELGVEAKHYDYPAPDNFVNPFPSLNDDEIRHTKEAKDE